ncbi:hypothetical protein MKZ38_004818 [Zalerion maritima]|uniref:Uncharacterized protein n=1 Tax=Zalerion maritima TaxID=339359 RepID=A0AAD5RLJ1_9PEZI|nr:hypothetical protein MKZ38_004818 [Zalerion maritima]
MSQPPRPTAQDEGPHPQGISIQGPDMPITLTPAHQAAPVSPRTRYLESPSTTSLTATPSPPSGGVETDVSRLVPRYQQQHQGNAVGPAVPSPQRRTDGSKESPSSASPAQPPAPPPYSRHPGIHDAFSSFVPTGHPAPLSVAAPGRIHPHSMLARRLEPFLAHQPEEQCHEEEEEDSESPITIRILCPIRVKSDNNIIALPDPTPSPTAPTHSSRQGTGAETQLAQLRAHPDGRVGEIAQGVLAAIKESTAGNCGLPMIDENGCPRPISIEVDAGLYVEGRGNVIGTKKTIESLLDRGVLGTASAESRKRKREDGRPAHGREQDRDCRRDALGFREMNGDKENADPSHAQGECAKRMRVEVSRGEAPRRDM